MSETINLRVREFCAAYGLSRAHLYALIKRGELRPIKIGKATRIPRAEAERWQRELERRAGIAA
jgi:excisionase family DNA binding protein